MPAAVSVPPPQDRKPAAPVASRAKRSRTKSAPAKSAPAKTSKPKAASPRSPDWSPDAPHHAGRNGSAVKRTPVVTLEDWESIPADGDGYFLPDGRMVRVQRPEVEEKPRRRCTLEEYEAMPDAKRFELLDGWLVERNMSYLSSMVGARLVRFLGDWAEPLDGPRRGWVTGADAQFRCFDRKAPGRRPRAKSTAKSAGKSDGPRQHVRLPDASFIRFDRMPEGPPATGMLTIAPDLAVEVISTNDTAREVLLKVKDFHDAGVAEVWMICPHSRTVHVHRRGKAGSILSEGDILAGSDVMPGFRVPVARLFDGVPSEPVR